MWRPFGRGKLLPERVFVHAVEQEGNNGESSFHRLLQRDSLAFPPLQDAFVEEEILYRI